MSAEMNERARAEAAPEPEVTNEGWCLCDRLLGMSLAAGAIERAGWTLEGATVEPRERWSAGELVATTATGGGETLVYRLHFDKDVARWWHSVKLFNEATKPVYVASPAESVVPANYARLWLMRRDRERERAEQKTTATLAKFLNR